ncbi:polysaccharide deacetylase family protein [Carboxydothermus pertinax]|uniref:Polysaccharide deacetylase n=1 Tax=Carboxydothermus pertinax TaxID=870242 RepID=A0A1L8CW16_9THEO|nr:polysaccharide deacetylase family protein [Carboxydothermus pertinax]GAV23093.1 polysaccharide deacetylase [Carboxydothermus pertinax]
MKIFLFKRVFLILGIISFVFLLSIFCKQTVFVTSYLNPIYQGNPDKKKVAFLCNVYWGEDILPEMLKIFEREKVKVSFFIGGIWAKKNPDILKMLYNAGHEIGNHGYLHKHPDRLSIKENEEEILKTEKIIEELTGYKTRLYTPPYGERGENVLRAAANLNYKTILWSIDTIDWQKPAPDTIIYRVIPNITNGAIILIHPMPQTLQALPELIKIIKRKGYQIVTVGEILE